MEPQTLTLQPFQIFRRSSKLSVVNLTGYGLSLLTGLVVARLLGPENVGILAVVGVWTFYLRLLRPGWLSVAGREMPPLFGSGQHGEARRIQNVALTGELLFSLIPCVVLVVAGALSHHLVIRISLWLSAAAFAVTTVQSAFQGLLFVYHRFDLVVRMTLILSIGGPAGTLLMLPWLGIYSPLVMPALAAAMALIVVVRQRELFRFRPAWDWATGKRLTRVGVSLTLLTAVGWAYLMSDRPAILAAGIPLATFGYYAFASNVVRGLAQVFWDFTAVLQPALWQEMGRRGSVQDISAEIMRVWVPYVAAGCAAVSFGQAAFGAVVAWIAPAFARSVQVFEVLLFVLVFHSATQLPNLILSASLVNRQHILVLLGGGGLALNVVVLYLLARAGCGLPIIAAASMGVDAVIAVVGYAAMHWHLFRSWKPALGWYGMLVGLAALTVVVYGVFQHGALTYSPGRHIGPLVLRTLIASSVWGSVAVLMRRWWVPASDQLTAPLGAPRPSLVVRGSVG